MAVAEVVDPAQPAAARAVDAGQRVERADAPGVADVGVAQVERDRGCGEPADREDRAEHPLRPCGPGGAGLGRQGHRLSGSAR